jgi:hypothetical protein
LGVRHIFSELFLDSQPVDEGQKWLQNQALEENILLLRQRWLLIEGGGPSVRPAYIGILVFWVMLIFASFGFSAPRNATVVIGFLCCPPSPVMAAPEGSAPPECRLGVRSNPARVTWPGLLSQSHCPMIRPSALR